MFEMMNENSDDRLMGSFKGGIVPDMCSWMGQPGGIEAKKLFFVGRGTTRIEEQRDNLFRKKVGVASAHPSTR